MSETTALEAIHEQIEQSNGEPPQAPPCSIFLALPSYGTLEPSTLPGLMFATLRHQLMLNTNPCSLLAHNFNRLYASALMQRESRKLTHFAMIHSDVEAPAGWLDVLVDEMDAVGADVLSVVLPIKDPRGLTSTAWQDPATMRLTRFTMTQVMGFPETFDAALAGQPGMHLLVNTGLWVMRFTESWAEEVCFEVRDAIVKMPDGRFQARVLPEDWNFSAWCCRRGLKLFATRKVQAIHHGRAVFPNSRAWGEYEHDPGDPF